MAIEQVKLGRFGLWAQTLGDKGIIVLACFYGFWLEDNNEIDGRNQMLYQIVASREQATAAFKNWIVRTCLSADDKKTYEGARRQARRGYDNSHAFAAAEQKMLEQLIYEMFALEEE